MLRLRQITLILSFIYCARCHFGLENSKNLQPVHGLYVKPSDDGTTGDLYVAASEDDGVKSQWLTDKPINFLPSNSEQQSSKAAPVTLTSTLLRKSSPHEETITSQKRAVITGPTYKYAYALPGANGNLLAPYPYVMPTSKIADGSNKPCPAEVPTQAYLPYFYPYMLSALANAMSTLKDVENSEKISPAITSPTAPYWPHSYTYPYQYIMVDPSAWLQNENNETPSTTTASSESA